MKIDYYTEMHGGPHISQRDAMNAAMKKAQATTKTFGLVKPMKKPMRMPKAKVMARKRKMINNKAEKAMFGSSY